MATLTVGALETESAEPISLDNFTRLILGRAVFSVADFGNERFEFGLTGDALLKVLWSNDGIHLNLVSTTNEEDIPALLLRLPGGDPQPTARAVEAWLRGIRTVYAAIHLLRSDRAREMESALRSHRDFDLETLLSSDEMLCVDTLSRGSLIATLRTKLGNSYESAKIAIAAVYPPVRDAVVRKIQADARRSEVEVETQEFRLLAEKTNFVLDLKSKMEDPEVAKILERRVTTAVSEMLAIDRREDEAEHITRKLLEGPTKDEGGDADPPESG